MLLCPLPASCSTSAPLRDFFVLNGSLRWHLSLHCCTLFLGLMLFSVLALCLCIRVSPLLVRPSTFDVLSRALCRGVRSSKSLPHQLVYFHESKVVDGSFTRTYTNASIALLLSFDLPACSLCFSPISQREERRSNACHCIRSLLQKGGKLTARRQSLYATS